MQKFSLVRILVTIFSSLVVVAAPATALAARPAHAGGGSSGGGGTTTVLTGNDVSWPQCGKRLPSGQAFGIVGVNNGLANQANPCFSTELAWAQSSTGGTKQDKAALYVNTANPGDVLEQYNVTDWPTSGYSDKYGTCTGTNTNDAACAYQYGRERAMADAQQFIGGNNPANFKWWLDVETDNSWSTNTGNNVADLEGMVDYFTSLGARVGLYSTQTQWNQITGTVGSASSLYGLDSWLAGASSLSSAQTKCSDPGLTNGKTAVTQYVSKRTDYDYSCV